MSSVYTSDPDPDQSIISLTSTSTSTSSKSKMTTAEIALVAVFGTIIFLGFLCLSIVCIRKKISRSGSTINSNTLQQSPSISNSTTQSQPSRLPLHQPSESPSSFSSFTRISPNSPEMISVSSPRLPIIRSTSAAAVVSFSLTRFFSKQPSSSSSSSKRVPGTYPYGQDYSLQKTLSMTSSTPSSVRDYYWDTSQSGKQSTKDGFPVITLTSPTNSEYSIPIPIPPPDDTVVPIDYNQVPTFSFSSSSTSLASVASTSPSSSTPVNNSFTSQSPNYPTINLPIEEGSSSSTPSKTLQDHPYFLNQSVPQHMLLHPSYTYTKPIESEVESSTASGSGSPTDFPPTYEEAVDYPDSSSTSSGSTSNSKAFQESPPSSPTLQEPRSSSTTFNQSDIPLEISAVDSIGSSRGMSSHYLDSSSSLSIHHSDVPLYQESGWTKDTAIDEQAEDLQADAGISMSIEDDPLASLSLRRSSIYSVS